MVLQNVSYINNLKTGLPKGTYVFEYSLIVTHKGEFSNGITTMQRMYAPEFVEDPSGQAIRKL
ncbi:MAG: hypothetical protein IIC76_05730 [Bacteroidetes bacterium]|nr:hypothetical protein [Bacteroidota bacterium]